MAGGFSILLRTSGIKGTEKFFSRAEHEIKNETKGRLKKAAALLANRARKKTHSKRVRKAISFDVEVKSPTNWKATIGPDSKKAFFAHFLEFGTRHSRAFPFMKPALDDTEDEIVEIVGVPPVLAGGGGRAFSRGNLAAAGGTFLAR